MSSNVVNSITDQRPSFLQNMTLAIAHKTQYYLFITNNQGHWVYYLTGDEQNGYVVVPVKIPYYIVHWDENNKVDETLYSLNRSIDGEGMDNEEEFVKDYIDFYDNILRNLTRFSLGTNKAVIPQLNSYKLVEEYVNISNSFSEVIYNPLTNKKDTFEQTKDNLKKIIKNIQQVMPHDYDEFGIPGWYTDNKTSIQHDEMDIEKSPQSSNDAQTQGALVTQTAQPARTQGVVNGSSSTNSGNNTNSPSNFSNHSIPSNPSNNPRILKSTAQDVHGFMSNQLHDMLHDYAFADDFKRTNGMDRFTKDVRDQLGYHVWHNYDNFKWNFKLTQAGGALVDVLQRNTIIPLDMPHEPVDPNEIKKQKIIASINEIETTHRPFLNTLYRYLYSWFVAHLYNYDTVDFDLRPNLDLFMTMTGATNSKATIASKVHNYFVRECFFNFEKKYEKTKNFIEFYKNISETDSTTVTGENTLVEYFVLKKQSGGAAKKGTGKEKREELTPEEKKMKEERHTWTYSLLLTIAESFKKRYIPDYPKTYNHFLRAQQDVLNMALRHENLVFFDLDTAILHQAIDIIRLNTMDNDITTVDNTRFQNDILKASIPIQKKYIIDNSMLSRDFFKDSILCCQSTIDDGITEFPAHACYGQNAMDSPNNMNVKIRYDDNLYIQYERGNKSWRVTWKSQRNTFTYALPRTNTLVAEDRFTAAIGNLVKKWNDIQRKITPQEKRDALSDAMYEHIIFKSMGDILQELNGVLKNGGYVSTPNYSNTDVVTYNHDALRLVLSNDRPSATRILWYLYNGRNLGSGCNSESSDWTPWINQQASGGFLTPKSACFIYNPGRTNVVPRGSIIYRTDHKDYPLIPFMKNNNIFIGKKLSSMNHPSSYNQVTDNEFQIALPNNPALYQAYFICFNDVKIYLNSLNFTGSRYSPIILNVINEKLLQGDMAVTPFKTTINNEPYAYEQNHGFMSIDNISRGNYFYYTTGDDFYIRHTDDGVDTDFKILKQLINTKDNSVHTNHCGLNRKITGSFYFQKFRPPPPPPSTLPKDTSIIELVNRNNSTQVLNSETYYYGFITYANPYSLVVYLDDDKDVTTTTHENVLIPPIECDGNGTPKRKRQQQSQLTSRTPSSSGASSPVSMEEDNEIPDDRVFTKEAIKNALEPLAAAANESEQYNKLKKKFPDTMTYGEIKKMTLPRGVQPEAFHSKLKNMTGGSQQTGGMWQRGGFFMVCS